MATSNDLLIKQRSIIEFLAPEGCSAASIRARMETVYGEMCISDCAVRKWSPNSGRLKAAGTYDPAYSPDFAPSDYYLFPQLKKYLKGHHYDNDEEAIADVRRRCRGQSSEFFADGVRQSLKRWRLCVDRDGDFAEK
ncbi:histone-lysine N-methyltransferase SETMAR [Plakobranchus ocellatus]|uniref:Histone-lysine N-methyltransferase SETMAR n=1 Tax=Plakobranchus ocellatus TaxID=259542 RepID=A0AAV3YBQ7_9GAST|nr:histone-lysine N-methyltransferase SETMAR [Plakobranchus ocellatus]